MEGKALHGGSLREENWGPQASGMWELQGIAAKSCQAELQRNVPRPFHLKKEAWNELG